MLKSKEKCKMKSAMIFRSVYQNDMKLKILILTNWIIRNLSNLSNL